MNPLPPPGLRALQRARTARRWLLAFAALLLADLGLTVVGVLSQGGIVSLGGWAPRWDAAVRGLLGTRALLLIPAGLAVIRCQRELLRGLHAAGIARVVPGVTFASFSWFVPFVNLVVPYRSFRLVAAATPVPRRQVLLDVIGWWWASWLLGGVLTQAAARLFARQEDAEGWLLAAGLDLVGNGMLLWSGFLLAALLPRLAQEQAEVAMLLATSVHDPVFANPAGLGAWLDQTLVPRVPEPAS